MTTSVLNQDKFIHLRLIYNVIVLETEEYHLVLGENPPAMPRSPHTRMARWPKTTVELGKCIGAESVRTMRREKVLCLWCVQQVHL